MTTITITIFVWLTIFTFFAFCSDYGTTQPQVEQPSQPHPSSTQPGYPPQPTYDYSQWQGTQHTTSDISGGVLRQQELESSSSSRREGAESVGSGDSHVTGKKVGEAKESRGKDESKKGRFNI